MLCKVPISHDESVPRSAMLLKSGVFERCLRWPGRPSVPLSTKKTSKVGMPKGSACTRSLRPGLRSSGPEYGPLRRTVGRQIAAKPSTKPSLGAATLLRSGGRWKKPAVARTFFREAI